MHREDVHFPAGDGRCAAWLYRPPGGAPGAGADRDARVPCVVLGHGFSLTRHDGLDAYAERLAAVAGVAALAFDYRFFGDSPGRPRQRFRVGLQQEDWEAAVAFGRSLPGIDSERIVLWCFSFASVYALRLAAADRRIAAVLAVAPFADSLWRAVHTPPQVSTWVLPRAGRRRWAPHDDPRHRAGRVTRGDVAPRRGRGLRRRGTARLA